MLQSIDLTSFSAYRRVRTLECHRRRPTRYDVICCSLNNRLAIYLPIPETNVLQHSQNPPNSYMSISTLSRADWTQWQGLFRQYIAFYNASIPEQQYKNTFDRILDTESDLHAFVIREEDGTLNGIAHFLYHTSSWSDKPVCYLNGTSATTLFERLH